MSPRARQTGARPNRSDLSRPLPVTAAEGQDYGVAARQRADQGVIPMAPGASPAAPSAAPVAPQIAPGGAGSPPPAPAPAGALKPGSLPWLEPTTRPNEPVTNGLDFGPGAGPEALAQKPTLVSDTLASLARSPDASARLQTLTDVAKSLGV
jgi:hypothetical protein